MSIKTKFMGSKRRKALDKIELPKYRLDGLVTQMKCYRVINIGYNVMKVV